MSKLKVKKVIIFKHGVSYFILEGTQRGTGTFELEFKIDEMNDVLKSLFVLDTSESGYISSISYDAALDTYQLLKSVMLDIPDSDSFSSLITQIKGAKVNLTIGTSDNLTGTIMGIEYVEKLNKEGKITEKLLTLLKDDDTIVKIPEFIHTDKCIASLGFICIYLFMKSKAFIRSSADTSNIFKFGNSKISFPISIADFLPLSFMSIHITSSSVSEEVAYCLAPITIS